MVALNEVVKNVVRIYGAELDTLEALVQNVNLLVKSLKAQILVRPAPRCKKLYRVFKNFSLGLRATIRY